MSNWLKVTLGDLQKQGKASLQTGPFGTVLKASEYSDTGVPVISVGEIRNGYIQISNSTPKVNQKTVTRLSRYELHNGDIVFGRKGAINRNARIGREQSGWFLGSDAIRLRLSEDIDSVFVSYQLMSPLLGKWLLQNSHGSIMASLNQKILDRVTLFLPPKKLQEEIATVLSSLDAKIDCNNRINTELESMAKTLYDYWFVQFDFPDENGKPYKSSGGEMVYNDVLKREIPVGWSCKTLATIANITMGQSPAGKTLNENVNGMIFFQGSTDFGWRFPIVRQYTTKPSRTAKKGDILLSVRAPVGDINIAACDCCIGRGLSALHSKEGFDGFLFYVMEQFKQVFDRRDNEGTTFGSIIKEPLNN